MMNPCPYCPSAPCRHVAEDEDAATAAAIAEDLDAAIVEYAAAAKESDAREGAAEFWAQSRRDDRGTR